MDPTPSHCVSDWTVLAGDESTLIQSRRFLGKIAGAAIEKLCEMQYEDAESSPGTIGADKGSMVRAARCLLAAVTQVLLLADNVVVKQLLLAKDKVRLCFL
jgi:hypothetical protein